MAGLTGCRRRYCAYAVFVAPTICKPMSLSTVEFLCPIPLFFFVIYHSPICRLLSPTHHIFVRLQVTVCRCLATQRLKYWHNMHTSRSQPLMSSFALISIVSVKQWRPCSFIDLPQKEIVVLVKSQMLEKSSNRRVACAYLFPVR